jgi:hypothetical protein
MSLRGTRDRTAPLRERGSSGRKTLMAFVVTLAAPRGRMGAVTP